MIFVKKSAILLVIVLLINLFCSCGSTNITLVDNEHMKAVWISFYELDFEDKTENGFISKFNDMMKQAKNIGFNAVIVHIRPRADAFYYSNFFPISEFASGKQGLDPHYDPMKIMIKLAHSNGLQFHAWINPFRVAPDTDLSKLDDKNKAKIWLSDNDKSNDDNVIAVNGGLWFNPTSEEVRRLVVSGVKEIVENYDVDGVHMDDYFYPTTDKKIDKTEYAAYCKDCVAPLPLSEYRMAVIDSMISDIYRTVKQINKSIVFGISPQANMDNNLHQQYANAEKWCKNKGFVDYITPQVYFGFDYDYVTASGQSMQFCNCVDYWSRLCCDDVALYIGLGLYKCGTDADSKNGVSEFNQHSDIMKRQIEYCKGIENCGGVMVFSFSCMNQNKIAKAETENVKNAFCEY